MAITTRPEYSLQSLPHRLKLVVGIGCTRGTGGDEIIALIADTLIAANATADALCAIGTLDSKADELGLVEAARHFDLPLRLFTVNELAALAQQAPGRSAAIATRIGIPAVAEAVALQAGTLLVGKHKSAHATCALGICDDGFDLALFGRGATVPYSPNAEIAASRLATSSAGP